MRCVVSFSRSLRLFLFGIHGKLPACRIDIFPRATANKHCDMRFTEFADKLFRPLGRPEGHAKGVRTLFAVEPPCDVRLLNQHRDVAGSGDTGSTASSSAVRGSH